MVDKLTLADFEGCLNQTFRVHFGETAIEAELVEASPMGGTHEKDQRPPFSVVLQGPQEALFEQAVYKVEHETLGAMDLFLVPLGPKGEGMLYEAVFT